MEREELAIREAARGQDLSVHRDAAGMWSIGLSTATEPLGIEARQADTFLSGGRIRLADGREFKREMTTTELRSALGLDPHDDGA